MVTETQHVRDVRLAAEHLVDKDRDGVPDELQRQLSRCRALKLWSEQNEHQHAIAPEAKSVALDYERILVGMIESFKAVQKEMPPASPYHSQGDTANLAPAVSSTADTERPIVVDSDDESVEPVKTRKGKRS